LGRTFFSCRERQALAVAPRSSSPTATWAPSGAGEGASPEGTYSIF
jgi:hypothetical protein